MKFGGSLVHPGASGRNGQLLARLIREQEQRDLDRIRRSHADQRAQVLRKYGINQERPA